MHTKTSLMQLVILRCGTSLTLLSLALGGLLADESMTPQEHKYTNELIHSTSPYLLQHAHNPVNWMPWGEAAFAKARAENKPIFVSIGYSTCYWCHVMERESFENEDVAKVINEHYVAIKVDREERPDIDEQMMLATQLMAGRGGWPNSVWLTTDGKPWMAGTYFPREPFIDALSKLSQVWETQAAAVQKQADSLSAAIRDAAAVDVSRDDGSQPRALDDQPMLTLMAELNQLFDSVHGGFGGKPKFPPHGALRLLAVEAADGNQRAEQILTKTLDAIWCGGIHDHVGGGFHRYSTDEKWFLPHFEKMLYDNAQLVRAFSEAYEVTHLPQYRAAMEDIVGWLEREMTDERGGFYSAIDSESEGGEEGRYYTWSLEELTSVLGESEARYFASAYNCQPKGNFLEEATGDRPGTNILFLNPAQMERVKESRLTAARDLLLKSRVDREYPHLDDKVLTSWNGLMISGLARASVVFEEPRYLAIAERAAEFILAELRRDGKLYRTWRRGKASLPGYLNDYAFFAEAMVELHLATGDTHWQQKAIDLTNEMLDLFEDSQNGGFFFTSEQHEILLLRSKNLTGGGNLPVGNGIAVQVLQEMYRLTADPRYLAAAERALQSFSGLMQRSPRQVEHLILANVMHRKSQLAGKSSRANSMSQPQASHDDPVLQASLFVSHDVVKPGSTFQAAVLLEIAPRYHLYGASDNAASAGRSSADNDLVQATTVTLQSIQNFSTGIIRSPAGESSFDPVLGQTTNLYRGRVWFYIPVTVESTAPEGEIDFELDIACQACDDTQCLAPKTISLKCKVFVSSTRVGKPINTDVFKN